MKERYLPAKNRSEFVRWINRYGAEKVILGADCKNRKIATDGWLKESDTDVIEFIQSYEQNGIRDVISTDISKDGMLEGPSINLYKDILNQTQVNLIASGGVSNINDLYRLKDIGCSGIIIGKAIYEGRITMKELSELC